MMQVKEMSVSAAAMTQLPNANYFDAFAGQLPRVESALQVARLVLERPFPLLRWLLALRNLIVKPFGLVTSSKDAPNHARFIGMFPILSASARVLVLGLDDRHLDFRLVVEIPEDQPQGTVIATTLVQTHGIWGKIYLAIVKPFHRWLVPQLIKRASARG